MPHTSETRSAAAHAFVQSAGAKLLIIGLNAATGILSARALQPSGRGELAAMILWYAFLANAFTLGIPSALTYQLRKHPEHKSELVGAALLLSTAISILVACIGFFGLPHWMPQYSHEVIFFARLFLLNTPISTFFLVGRAAVESQGGFGVSNLSLLGPPSFTLLALAGLWLTHTFTPVNAAWCYVPAGLPSLYWLMRGVHRSFHPRFRDMFRSMRLLFSYGIRSYGIDLCGTMSIYVDQALVVRILKPSMMGTYVVALSLSRMLNAFHTAVVMVLFPRAVSQSTETILDMTGRAARMTTFITTICGAGIVLLGPQLLQLLYGPEYRGAAAILRILVLEVIISGATLVMSQAFMALSRPGVVTALQAFGLLLTLPMMLVLVPRYGIEGAALSLLLSTCARFLFVMGSFSRFLKMPRPDLMLKGADLRYMSSMVLRRFGVPQPSEASGGL
jgi:O-antigen/teichoic acid export membrane protein